MTDTTVPNLDQLQARMLRKQLWVVMTRPVKPLDEVRRHLHEHLQHQIRLEKAGIMYGAGPATRPGETRASFGLIIIRARDEAEARRIADSDPMHSSGVREYELYSWSLNEGCVSVTLNFSDQTFRYD
ncbi:MAG: YciI family protein [Xanthobacteraceae bacterium]